MLERLYSYQRFKNFANASKKYSKNVAFVFKHGSSVTKENAIDTLKEMRKIFSLTEAKRSISYGVSLAGEVHHELVGYRVRLFSNMLWTIYESQVNSLLNRNRFSVDNSTENDSENQE
uniref:Uncharacterized protein n=1 Tax=Euplotes harpa TaxID=151035 RepID=A0A7S3JI20_9SPIT